MKKTIAILGANGLLGSDLVKYLSRYYKVVPITRKNYAAHKYSSVDVLINANGNSRRYWALQNVYDDFEASTISVYKSIFDFTFKRYIYISSSDVYSNHRELNNTKESVLINVPKLNPYGFHKYLSEQIIMNRVKNYLILRSSMIIGQKVKKGPFYDITHDAPLFVTPDSELQLITTLAYAEVIKVLVEDNIVNEVLNIGGEGTFGFNELDKYFRKSIKWAEECQQQYYQMDVSKLGKRYNLKTSTEYLRDWIKDQR